MISFKKMVLCIYILGSVYCWNYELYRIALIFSILTLVIFFNVLSDLYKRLLVEDSSPIYKYKKLRRK